MDEFDRRCQLMVARSLVTDQRGPCQRQHRAQALPPAGDEMSGKPRDQRYLALHPVEDHAVDGVHARCRQ